MKIQLYNVHNNGTVVHEELGIAYIASTLRKKFETRLDHICADSFCIDDLISYNPQLIAFNSYDSTLPDILEISRLIKARLDSFILIGGYAATYHYEHILNTSPQIDGVIIGEGEITLSEIAEELNAGGKLSNCKGVVFRNDGGGIAEFRLQDKCVDLEKLPFPDRGILTKCRRETASIATSRGCLRNCAFCCTNSFWGHSNGKWRVRSIDSVMAELEHLYHEYNIRKIQIIDNSYEDNAPNTELPRYVQIADEIKKRQLLILYNIDMRVETYRELGDTIVPLAESGLSTVFLGIESGNDCDLKLYRKGHRVSDISKAYRFFTENDICVDYGFISFNPYSTIERLRDNVKVLSDINSLGSLSFHSKLDLYKGTYLEQLARRNNLTSCTDTFIGYRFADSRVESVYNTLLAWEREYQAVARILSTSYKSFQRKIYRAIQAGKMLGDLEAYYIGKNTLNKYNNITQRVDVVMLKWYNTVLNLNTYRPYDIERALKEYGLQRAEIEEYVFELRAVKGEFERSLQGLTLLTNRYI